MFIHPPSALLYIIITFEEINVNLHEYHNNRNTYSENSNRDVCVHYV